MEKFAVLIEPWAVYVKAWNFYVKQGGLRDPWGKAWVPIRASSIEAARKKGIKRRDKVAK